MSSDGNSLPKFMPILFFRGVYCFWGASGKGIQGHPSNFLSCFTGVYLVFEVLQTKVAHFCFCLVRIKMPLLICPHPPFPASCPLSQEWAREGAICQIWCSNPETVHVLGPKRFVSWLFTSIRSNGNWCPNATNTAFGSTYYHYYYFSLRLFKTCLTSFIVPNAWIWPF